MSYEDYIPVTPNNLPQPLTTNIILGGFGRAGGSDSSPSQQGYVPAPNQNLDDAEGRYYTSIGYTGDLRSQRNEYYADLITSAGSSAQPQWYGVVGTGLVDDSAAWDRFIESLNSRGHVLASMRKILHVTVPPGVYDLRQGGIRNLLVSNVAIEVSPWAVFILRDGSPFILGNSVTLIENFKIRGGAPCTNPGDTVAPNASFVYAINATRVYIDELRLTRCQIFKAESNMSLSTIYIRDCTGSGMIDRSWIYIDTSSNSASAAAGLFIINCGGYAYVPPANPTFHPHVITGATQANPVVVTAVNHGFQTGARIRFGGIAGMTQLNGQDATITRLTADTFSLNGVNGTGFGAYVSGGWASELLWTWQYDTAVVEIKGHWDTVVMDGGLYQHWPWLWKLNSYGPISFVWDEEVGWDFGGSGRMKFEFNGGSYSSVKINGGWNFTFNDDCFSFGSTGIGTIADLTIRGLILGMTGKSFLDDNANDRINYLEIDGMLVWGAGRARVGNSYLVRPGNTGNNSVTLRGIKQINPGGMFAEPQLMKPDVGVSISPSLRAAVENCDLDCLSTHYDIPLSTSSAAGYRRYRNNRKRLGGLPEYCTTATQTMPASDTAETNHSGLTKQIFLSGGTMTSIKKNGATVLTGAGPFVFDVGPEETWACVYSVVPTLTVAYRD